MRSSVLLAGASLVAFSQFSDVKAQTQPSVTPEASSATDLGEVIVTARRREERLQDVPIAVTVISGAQLQTKAVTRLDDLARNVPALQMQPGAFSKNVVSYTIRSQRQGDPILTQENSVGVYFADVVQARPHGSNAAFFDIASVQVLKGPQGTLFGRNTTGGAIVITPQSPTDRFEGYGRVTLGNFDQRVGEAAVNLPLGDSVQLRLAGQINRRDGFVHNLFDGRAYEDEHNESWRASLRFKPNEVLENRLVVGGFHAEENGAAGRLIGVSPPATLLFPALSAAFANISSQPFYTVSNDNRFTGGDNTRINTFNVSNISEIDLGSVTVKNILGYRRLKSSVTADVDSSPFFIFEATDRIQSKQLSNELQVYGTALGDSLDYIAGAFYIKEEGVQTLTNAPLGAIRSATGDVENVNKALFAQATYKLPFAESVSVTGGVRWNWDDRSVTLRNTAGAPPVCSLLSATNVVISPCVRPLSAKFEKMTYTASVDWKPTDDVLLYLTHRKGYRPGGFNLRALTPQQAIPYRSETVQDFEVGSKLDWSAGGVRGRLNLAAYHQDYRNIQRGAPAIVNGQFVGQTIVNAASAKIDGFEVEATISPVRGLELSAFYSYSHPKYKKYLIPTATGGVTDLSGSPFGGAPENSGGGSVTYTYDLEDGGNLVATASVYAQSGTYVSDGTLNPVTLVPYLSNQLDGYTIANARAEWNRVLGSNASVALYVRNVLKEKYFTSGTDLISLGLGANSRALGAPRTYGVELYYAF